MDTTAQGATTVVVSRRVHPGREADFERWQRRVLRAAQKAPGYLDASLRPPGPDHPADWVVVYRFATADDLDLWLASPERLALVRQCDGLLSEHAREQRIVEPPSESVTLVSSVRLRPGTEDEHRAQHDVAVARARALGGLVRADLLPAIPGAQPETVALLTFTDRASLDRWLGSDARREAIADLDRLAEGDRTINVVGDFAGWFGESGGATARRWKQAVVIWSALVPTAYATSLVRAAVAPDLPALPALALGAAVNVVLLTWLVMPPLTRSLHRWLTR